MANLHIIQKEEILSQIRRAVEVHEEGKEAYDDITRNKILSKHLIQTDPSCEQWAVKINEDKWVYSEFDPDESFGLTRRNRKFRTETMEMADYTEKQLDDNAKAYHRRGLLEVKEIYGDDWKQLALEFMFEQGL